MLVSPFRLPLYRLRPQHLYDCTKRITGQFDKGNLGLLATRRVTRLPFNNIFITNIYAEYKIASHDRNTIVFPLWIRSEDTSGALFEKKGRLIFNPQFMRAIAQQLRISAQKDLPRDLTPEGIFHYIYAVFHSPGYRNRYAEFLKIDFPRLPLTGRLELFRELARLGGELAALHLLESPKLHKPTTEFIGGRNPEVEKVSWTKNTVWLDKTQTIGFKGVHEDVWNFHIGGYQVCHKWLDDRRKAGRTLSKDDIAHYQKIVVALSETIRLMKKIDEVIDQHGGWPGAFTAEPVAKADDKRPKKALLRSGLARGRRRDRRRTGWPAVANDTRRVSRVPRFARIYESNRKLTALLAGNRKGTCQRKAVAPSRAP